MPTEMIHGLFVRPVLIDRPREEVVEGMPFEVRPGEQVRITLAARLGIDLGPHVETLPGVCRFVVVIERTVLECPVASASACWSRCRWSPTRVDDATKAIELR